MHDYQHYTGRGERGGANGDCMFLKENPTCNKDIWLLSSAWAWRVAATLLSNTSTVGLIVKQNHENAWDIFWRIANNFHIVIYLYHAHKPICQSISSWVSSKVLGFILQACCWFEKVWSYGSFGFVLDCFGFNIFSMFWFGFQIFCCLSPVELLSSFPAIVLHPVTLKRQLINFVWFPSVTTKPKHIYLYILHSRQCFLQAAALSCLFVCTSFHRCESSWDF